MLNVSALYFIELKYMQLPTWIKFFEVFSDIEIEEVCEFFRD